MDRAQVLAVVTHTGDCYRMKGEEQTDFGEDHG